MKKIIALLIAVHLCAALCSCGIYKPQKNNATEDVAMTNGYRVLNYENMKGVWLSQYDLVNIYTVGGKQRDVNEFITYMERVLDKVAEIGLNTVIVQVRPFADSMYPSEYYPMCAMAVGAYGNKASYDPFAIIVKLAHERELSVHAWINPLRAMTDEEIKKVPSGYKIKEWYDDDGTRGRLVKKVSGRWYLDPFYEETRKLICDGAAEIVRIYDVDAVHMDDYFYPTSEESFDAAEYAEYKKSGGGETLAQFRRGNVNTLVREIYAAVKNEDENVLFGISPAGVMWNNYNALFADVAEWCSKEGYIDYICPQVYFGFEHATCDFVKVCHEFADMIKCDGIQLVIGMILTKAYSETDTYAGSGKYEWRDNKDVLKRELEYALSMPECDGVCYFSYQYFFDPLTGEQIKQTSAECENLIPVLKKAWN